MGNSPSQESAPGPNEVEPFDLAAIPDDRDPVPDEGTGMAKVPHIKTSSNGETPRKKKRGARRRKSSNNTPNQALGEEFRSRANALNKPEEDTRPLKEREPETYHIYATSETESVKGAEDNVEDLDVTTEALAAPQNAQSPEPAHESGFPCPVAADFGCKETFSKKKAAARHAGVHTAALSAVESGDSKANIHDVEVVADDSIEDAQNAASDRNSSSPPSVFDDAEETLVKETPIPGRKLKRKRDQDGDSNPTQPYNANSRKRLRRSPNSPPTSVPSKDEITRSDSSEAQTAENSRQITDRIVPALKARRQGSIEGWAQKYTPGSNLRHPTFNPKSPSGPATQKVEVVIPGTSQAGPSSMKSKVKGVTAGASGTPGNHEGLRKPHLNSLRANNPRMATYATPKGKSRADPGVEYSTPSRGNADQGNEDPSEDEHSEPANMATSVANKTFSRNAPGETGDDSGSEFETPNSGDAGAEVSSPIAKKKPAATGTSVECPRCHRMFQDEKRLKKHLRKASSHVGLLRCSDCSEQYWASTALARHEKETGHGNGNGSQGRTGAFSDAEVNRLYNWRDQFCEMYDIRNEQFNDMMADTMKRGSGHVWSWSFVTKSEFLKEYLSVLPGRNKRSMMRYRERNFQNVEGYSNWTAADDEDLVKLHKQLGPKWSEIAQRLSRTADAVSQRWRNKLQPGKIEKGAWSRTEQLDFGKALEEVRRQSGSTALEEFQIPWSEVSKKIGTRSAQQCSNHYRALHGKKQQGKWVKVEGLESLPGSSRILTPSKMERRLNGENVRSSPRKMLSEKYIEDEDADQDGEKKTDNQPSKRFENRWATVRRQDESPEAEAEELPDETQRSPTRVIKKTPGKTLQSSQLFAQTQANTSALKGSQRSLREEETQDRPSPNIPIQRRRLSSRSPLQELKVTDDGELDLEEDEQEQEADAESNDEESEGFEATTLETKEQSTAEDGEETSPDATEDEDTEVAESGHVEAEAKLEADEDTSSDVDDDDDDEDVVDETSSEDDSEDSSEEDDSAQGDFMTSITQSAQRWRSTQGQRAKALDSSKPGEQDAQHEDDEDEDEEEEDEDDEIE